MLLQKFNKKKVQARFSLGLGPGLDLGSGMCLGLGLGLGFVRNCDIGCGSCLQDTLSSEHFV